MTINHRLRYLVTAALLAVAALALVSCSGDEPLAPADTGADAVTVDVVWQDARDDLARQIDDAALMEQLAPALEQARASLDDTALKHGSRFILTYSTTSVAIVPPFPPPTVHLHIDYAGYGTVVGRHTGFSDSYNDITVDPFTQATVSYSTDAHGDVLDWESFGGGENFNDGADVAFWGDITYTGGTGRYDGASGTASYYGEASNIELTGWLLSWGWINLDH